MGWLTLLTTLQPTPTRHRVDGFHAVLEKTT